MESFLSARAAGKLVAALLEKRKPLTRLKRKSSGGFAVAALVQRQEAFGHGRRFMQQIVQIPSFNFVNCEFGKITS